MHAVTAVPAEVQLCLESAPLADTDTPPGVNTQRHRIYRSKVHWENISLCVCQAKVRWKQKDILAIFRALMHKAVKCNWKEEKLPKG